MAEASVCVWEEAVSLQAAGRGATTGSLCSPNCGWRKGALGVVTRRTFSAPAGSRQELGSKCGAWTCSLLLGDLQVKQSKIMLPPKHVGILI